MSAFLKVAGRLGSIIALILLIVTLLKQLISLVSFLIVAIKVAIVIAFVGMMLLIVFAILRGRQNRKREADDI
jgi:predicted membrane protein